MQKLNHIVGALALMTVACGQGPQEGGETTSAESVSQSVVGASCDPSLPQPSGCGYGEYCSTATSTCVDVAPATCSNFASYPPTWSKVNGQDGVLGPVIYSVTPVSWGPHLFCMSDNATVRARVKMYATQAGELPSTAAALSLNYFRPSGSMMAANSLITGYSMANNGQSAEFNLSICVPLTMTTVTMGLRAPNGNSVCTTINK
ncbi:hypothetical protein [Myxococcus landrumensis]|uniref:Lipoprotein n=1 Tax=Myxococcus landrumensis TaxID=2813577 RepID=A0ABX7MX62_9BACT|nr:hypothetical protein [Myxococcus landrumus]QSQ11040.1 hypothetical protein JY572_21705 [Myxococcus landrumus]